MQTTEEIYQNLKNKCSKKQNKKKIFTENEIHAIDLMLDDNSLCIKSAAQEFHTDYRRISKIIELLKNKTTQDYKQIAKIINN